SGQSGQSRTLLTHNDSNIGCGPKRTCLAGLQVRLPTNFHRLGVSVLRHVTVTTTIKVDSEAFEKACSSPSGKSGNPCPRKVYLRWRTLPPNESSTRPRDQYHGR